MSTYDTIMAQQLKQRMDRASQAPPLNAPSLYPTQQNPLTTPPQLNVQQEATGGAQHQPKPQSQTAQQQPQMSYADMFVQLNPYRQPTPEELEAERKRYKRNAVFAAISDGLSALSNLYFTTKGAPNAYTGGSTLTGKMYERQKQLMQERQANQEKWLNGYLRAMEMDRNAANQERNWQLQLNQLAYNMKRNDEADKRAAAKEARDQELHELEMKRQAGLVKKGEYDTLSAAIKAKYAPQYEQSRISRNYRTGSGGGSGNSSNALWPFPINGEDIELPKAFWNNAGEVNALYSMLPKEVRDAIEHEYTPTGRVKKDIKPTPDQKRQAIMDNATPAIMDRLRAKSREFGGKVSQQPASSSAPWVNGQTGASSSNAPWLNNQ